MKENFLYLIIAGTVHLASVIFLLYVFLTKQQQKKMLALGLFLASGAIAAFCVVSMGRSTVAHILNGGVERDIKKGGELAGRAIGSAASGVSEGLSKSLDDEAIAKLANKTAVIATKSVRAMARGIDSTSKHTTVFMTKETEEAGIALLGAREGVDTAKDNVGVFLKFDHAVKGKLVLNVYDSNGDRKDVSEVVVDERAGAERKAVFFFKNNPPLFTGYCILSVERH